MIKFIKEFKANNFNTIFILILFIVLLSIFKITDLVVKNYPNIQIIRNISLI